MDTNFEMIEKYIYGELEGKELLDFEKFLASDNDIKHYPVTMFTRKNLTSIINKSHKFANNK